LLFGAYRGALFAVEPTAAVSLVVAVAGVLGAVLVYVQNRESGQGDRGIRAVEQGIQSLEAALARSDAEVKRLTAEVSGLRAEIRALRNDIQDRDELIGLLQRQA